MAKALGLSHGAVYTYADSKQALLYLALLRALDPEAVDGLSVPVAAPRADAIVDVVLKWAARDGSVNTLADALSRPMQGPEVSVESELLALVNQLYSFIENHRTTLRLVERCSAELPELAQRYFVESRRGTLARIGEFLSVRIEAGVLRPVPDVPAAFLAAG